MAKPKPAAADREKYLRFSRPADACLLCGVPLNVDGAHPSYLALADAEEAVRKDFCRACWEQMGTQSYFSFWLTKRVAAPTARERRLARAERNDALWRLFTALHATREEGMAPQLFLLAHLLMRYKILEFTGLRDGRLEFTHPKLGETFLVEDLPVETVDFAAAKAAVDAQVAEIAEQARAEREERAEGDDPSPMS
jgi:hypothetical protein